jgi:hypothetical protein
MLLGLVQGLALILTRVSAEPLELVCGLRVRDKAVAVRLETGAFESKPLEWCV